MSRQLIISDGTTSVDFYGGLPGFNVQNAPLIGIDYPADITTFAESAIRSGASIISRFWRNRQVIIPFMVQGATQDDLEDRIRTLNLLLRKASDYWIKNWGNRVTLRYRKPNATTLSYLDVFHGRVRFPHDRRVGSRLIADGTLELTCSYYFYPGSNYTLRNFCQNPSFEEGSAPGDSWTEENGADVTTALDTTIYKYGLQSLKMITVLDAGNDTGAYSDTITVTASTNYYVQAWGYHNTGDKVSLEVWDNSNSSWITLSTDVCWDDADDTWYKRGVGFTTPISCVAIIIYIHVESGDSSAGATFYLDGVYLGPGSTAPVGWASCLALQNHWDTGADDINYIDFEDIPGDIPARTEMVITPATGKDDYTRLQAFTRSREAAGFRIGSGGSVYEAEDADDDYGGAPTVDSACSGGDRVRWSADISTEANVLQFQNGSGLTKESFGRFKVFARTRDIKAATNLSLRFRIQVIGSGGASMDVDGDLISVPNRNASDHFALVDLGEFEIPPIETRENATYGTYFYVRAKRTDTSTDNWDIDCLFIMPIDEHPFSIERTQGGWGAGDGAVLDGVSEPPTSGITSDEALDGTYVDFFDGAHRGERTFLVLEPETPQRAFFLIERANATGTGNKPWRHFIDDGFSLADFQYRPLFITPIDDL